MSHSIKSEEAETVASLLPAIMRQLFTLDNDPAANLPLTQIRVCFNLLDGPRQMSTLSHELGVTLSAMTQIADRMERTKLVCRVAEEKDRRVRCLQLTPRGETIMRRHENLRIRSIAAVIEHLSPNERKELIAALETLLRASIKVNKEKSSDSEKTAGSGIWRRQLMMSKVIP
jgi:DNA-binding MarR family transcriptional regulator